LFVTADGAIGSRADGIETSQQESHQRPQEQRLQARLRRHHAKGSVTSKYIRTLDTALIMAADTISGYIQGLLDGIELKQTAYALDRDSRKAALARFLKRASCGEPEVDGEDRRLAA
jgi:hypothetical protein